MSEAAQTDSIPRILEGISSYKKAFTMLWIFTLIGAFLWQRDRFDRLWIFGDKQPQRFCSLNLADFGAVGDGITLNTEAFEKAVNQIRLLGGKGGCKIIVPAGKWLTGPFNLTSHMTLFLARGAEILGIDVSIQCFVWNISNSNCFPK